MRSMRTWVSVRGLVAPRIVTACVVVAGLVAAGVGASPAYARRAQVAQDRIPEDRAFEAEAVRPDRQAGGGVAAGAPVMIRPPFPPPALTRAQLMAALTNARPDLEGCLPAAGGRWRATVRASISARRGLAVRVTVTPREVAVSRCLDTAARRWLVPLEGRNVVGTVSATIRVGRTAPPPPPGPLPPPPPPSNSFDERQVHDALDRQRNELLRCLPAASTTTPGDIVLRTSVRPDGTIVLEGATLPSGIGGGPALGCLAGVVGRVRVPSPPASRPVTHVITLGR